MEKRTLRETVDSLRNCSATLDGKQMCVACSRHCLVQPRIEILDDAAAALSRFVWKDPAVEMPMLHKRVIVARETEPGQPLRVEEGYADFNGWWKVFGTRVKKIVAWMEMPEPPKEGEV